jgi:outer membrane lipoprotein-sorting protein
LVLVAVVLLFNLAGEVFSATKRPVAEESFDKSLQTLGGYSKYLRLESVSYDFIFKKVSGQTATAVQGKQFFKFHDDLGFRAREEIEEASGKKITVVTDSGTWTWMEGNPIVKNEDNMSIFLKESAFWLLSPFIVKESSCPLRYIGMGYYANKLTQRLEADMKAVPLMADAENFTLYLDTGTQQLDGVSFSLKGETISHFFTAYVVTRTLMFPIQRETMGPGGNFIESFSINNLAVNAYIDESLFLPPVSKP